MCFWGEVCPMLIVLMLCFVLINSVILNLLCLWVLYQFLHTLTLLNSVSV